MTPQPGDIVSWRWLSWTIDGTVAEVCYERTEIVSKDKLITRNGTKKNPAIIINHTSGNQVLKLQSELLSDD